MRTADIGKWLILGVWCSAAAHAQDAADIDPEREYRINAGDRLEISVWQEEELQREVVVRPDGGFSFPLAGELVAENRTVTEVRQELESRLARYIPDLVATVTVTEVSGNRIYVIGQVESPGAFVMNPQLDVLQALSLAGGMTAFANARNIRIHRRVGDEQGVVQFDYSRVSEGQNLEQNILLRSGDVIVVP